jgi:IS30 family transposase
LTHNLKLKRYIQHKLRLKWSPVQIAKELKKDYPFTMDMRIAPETIYAYLYVLPRGALKKELLSCLRQNRKRRHKQSRGVKMERSIEDSALELRNVPKMWRTESYPDIGKAI